MGSRRLLPREIQCRRGHRSGSIFTVSDRPGAVSAGVPVAPDRRLFARGWPVLAGGGDAQIVNSAAVGCGGVGPLRSLCCGRRPAPRRPSRGVLRYRRCPFAAMAGADPAPAGNAAGGPAGHPGTVLRWRRRVVTRKWTLPVITIVGTAVAADNARQGMSAGVTQWRSASSASLRDRVLGGR